MNNILSRKEIVETRKKLKSQNKKVVFTNGCYDILHAGHVDYLNKSKNLGDVLIVGINSDSSVQRIKGNKRPIINEKERAELIANLKSVDFVTFFDENTPKELIDDLVPDVLVKGADWNVEDIVGSNVVLSNGGEVKTIEFVSQQSTSKIIDYIIKKYCP